MEKIDIMHIVSGDVWAGAAVQVYHTLSKLNKESFNSFIAVLFNDRILGRKLEDDNVKTLFIDERKYNGLKILGILTKVIRDLRPGIIHVHGYKEHVIGQVATVLSGRRASVVRTFHGMSEVPKGLTLVKFLKSTFIHRTEKFFLGRGSSHIVAVSKDLEEFLSCRYPKASITQIYNGIALPGKNFTCRENIRKRFSIGVNIFWIGSVARLEPIKNLEMLISAGELLKSSEIDFRISIFGVGPMKRTLQNEIGKRNMKEYIMLQGFEEDILPIINAFDVFVLCSLHEGLPMSLLEAMSIGTPAICTRVGGMKEVVKDNHTGQLVASSDVNALCEAILRLKIDKSFRDKLVKNAKRKIQNEFLIQNTNKRLVGLYQNILNLGGSKWE